MRISIDSNRYSDYCRGVPEAVRVVEHADEVCLAFAVVGELRGGFRHGNRVHENERVLTRFLQEPRVSVIWADEATTHFYAEIYSELRRAGTPVPINDIWIAAIAIQHDLMLFSRDEHFARIPRLARI